MTSWMAIAPGTVLITGGRFSNGMFSLKPHAGGANGGALRSDGTREASARATNTRKEGLSRAISTMGPPGTLGTPARTESSSARNFTP